MLIMDEFKEVYQRFATALQKAQPDLIPQDIAWRLFFTIGSMAHLMSGGDLLKTFTQGRCDPSDVEGALNQLVQFSAAGFRASSHGDTP